jgi:hypothetical protein
MIKTVADFLEEFKSKGLSMINENKDVDHPGLIGNMYEGLTQAMLDKAIFQNLNLKIVSGKITNAKGQMTKQIDCMLVEGEGRKLPFTNDWIYHYNQVIAVIEVKKNLFSSDLASSYENLKSVLDVSREPERDGDHYIVEALRDAWRGMLRTELPLRQEVDYLSEEKQAIYHTLFMEAYFRVRIVIGYYGYKTENSLREGFVNLLEESLRQGIRKGFGIGSFPSLIICGNNSIIKNNGMPYFRPFNYNNPFYWHISVSSNKTPIVHLLEVIWTRLSYKYDLSSSIFGDDFDFAPTHPFLDCKFSKLPDGTMGWEYNYQLYTDDALNAPQSITVWQPAFISQLQAEVLLLMTRTGSVNYITDTSFINLMADSAKDVDDIVNNLVSTGLVYKKENEIHFLTDRCEIVVLPSGEFVAGENKSGELSHWLNKYLNEREKS